MKFEKTALANSFALATAILWTLCTAFVLVLPVFSTTVIQWLMHGMDISTMGGWNLTLGSFVLGGASITLSAWVAGWILGWSWEKVN